jgi:mono/diheme cytochrome c family protein
VPLVLLVLALVLVSCGGTTTTTVAPVTAAAPTTTDAPATTEAPTTTAGPTTTAAEQTTSTVASDPAALFAQYCSGCHKNVPGASLAAATKIITSGRESMPAFGDQLTPDQLSALAAWVANGGK